MNATSGGAMMRSWLRSRVAGAVMGPGPTMEEAPIKTIGNQSLSDDWNSDYQPYLSIMTWESTIKTHWWLQFEEVPIEHKACEASEASEAVGADGDWHVTGDCLVDSFQLAICFFSHNFFPTEVGDPFFLTEWTCCN